MMFRSQCLSIFLLCLNFSVHVFNLSAGAVHMIAGAHHFVILVHQAMREPILAVQCTHLLQDEGIIQGLCLHWLVLLTSLAIIV